ncbi:hypothetical protein ACWDBD_45610 [Streptomyces sp. NPDC001118]
MPDVTGGAVKAIAGLAIAAGVARPDAVQSHPEVVPGLTTLSATATATYRPKLVSTHPTPCRTAPPAGIRMNPLIGL